MNRSWTTRQWSVDGTHELVVVQPAPGGRSAVLIFKDTGALTQPDHRRSLRGGIEVAKAWAEARAGHYLAWRVIPDALADEEVLDYVVGLAPLRAR